MVLLRLVIPELGIPEDPILVAETTRPLLVNDKTGRCDVNLHFRVDGVDVQEGLIDVTSHERLVRKRCVLKKLRLSLVVSPDEEVVVPHRDGAVKHDSVPGVLTSYHKGNAVDLDTDLVPDATTIVKADGEDLYLPTISINVVVYVLSGVISHSLASDTLVVESARLTTIHNKTGGDRPVHVNGHGYHPLLGEAIISSKTLRRHNSLLVV